MFRPSVILLALFAAQGCTQLQLQRSTLSQARTLTDLQYQQVLDNLASFAASPEALPWHLKLTGGSVQVQDQGTAQFSALFGDVLQYGPLGAAQRGIVSQWSVVPTVDDGDLAALQLAYRRTIEINQGIDNRKTVEGLYDAICEFSVSYDVVLDKSTLDKAIEYMKANDDEKAHPEQSEAMLEARRSDLKRKNKELHEQLEEELDNLNQLSLARRQPDRISDALKARIDERTRINIFEWQSGRSEDQAPPKGVARSKAFEDVRKEQEDFVRTLQPALEARIVNLTRQIGDVPFVPRYPSTGRSEHNIGLIEQVQGKIKTLVELAQGPEDWNQWVHASPAKPKRACLVGHYCGCNGECYVFVCPADEAKLRKFTLQVLSLSPPEASEVPSPFPGPAYSPFVSGAVR